MNKVLKIVFIVIGSIGVIITFILLLGFIGEKIEDKRYDREVMEEYSEIDFDVPSEFEKFGRYHSYSYYGDNESCRFSVLSSEKYNEDFENWFKSTILTDLNDEVGALTRNDLNGNETLFVEVKSNNSTEHHYGLRSLNYYYHIEYTINTLDNENNKCIEFEDEILSSIKIKE